MMSYILKEVEENSVIILLIMIRKRIKTHPGVDLPPTWPSCCSMYYRGPHSSDCSYHHPYVPCLIYDINKKSNVNKMQQEALKMGKNGKMTFLVILGSNDDKQGYHMIVVQFPATKQANLAFLYYWHIKKDWRENEYNWLLWYNYFLTSSRK